MSLGTNEAAVGVEGGGVVKGAGAVPVQIALVIPD